MKCNCRNIEEMLRKILRQTLVNFKEIEEAVEDTEAIAKIVGCEDPDDPDLPADVENLIDDEKTKAETIPELLAHMIDQLDGVLGQFPVKIKIKDTDPLTEGDQEQTIEIPNIAEFLAELFALSIDIEQGTTITMASIPRFATEIAGIKATSIRSEAYARCNAGYLGYALEMFPKSVPLAFDPAINEGEEKTMSQLLQNSSGLVPVPIETDKNAVSSLLAEIKANTEMLKAVHVRKPSQIDDLISSVLSLYKEFRGGDPANSEEDGSDSQSEAMKKLLKLINDSDFYKQSADSPRPTARKLSPNEIKKDQSGESVWG